MTKKRTEAARERKQAERDRKRKAGLVKVEVWVRADDAERVRRYVERLNRKRELEGVER